MAPTQSTSRQAVVYGMTAVLAWSTVPTAFKLALRHLDHYQLLLLANIFSLLALASVLLVRSWRRRGWPAALTGTQLGQVAVLGVLNPCLYYLVLFKAYALLPAQIAQPLNITWAFTLAVPLLGQRMRRRDLVGGLVCYIGVVLIASGGGSLVTNGVSGEGVALALGSTVVWALYWLGNARLCRDQPRLDPVLVLCWEFVFSLPLVAAATWIFSAPKWSGPGLGPAIYIGLVEMGFTFVLWSAAVRLSPNTARIANLIFAGPFLSLFWIHLFLGEAIAPATVVGLVLVSGGLLWQSGGRRI